MASPTVNSGYRAPRGMTIPEGSEKPRNGSAVGFVPDGKRVYAAKAARYTVLHTAPQDLRFSDGRIVKGEKPLKSAFSEFTLVLDVEKDAKRIEFLDSHPDYGKDFWNLQDELDRARQKKINSAVKLLEDPVAREAILEALQASGDAEFTLPARK